MGFKLPPPKMGIDAMCSDQSKTTATVALEEAAVGLTLQCLIARFWREAEKSTGGRADLCFVEEGKFIIDGMVEALGREAIRKVGAYRQELGRQQNGARHSRHLMSNFDFDLGALATEGKAIVRAVMTHFGGTGNPPLKLEAALAIYDVTITADLQPEGAWLLASLHMQPVFVAENHPARNMPREYSHHGRD
ncbi:hypothetical protein GRI89_13905 [Altererythrobacter salegens]|uniref:SnoaL-like domain-containing protein n=1 Tax=Croceibacterium salegens TaxID=1737568 RepID=A0A6I4SX27_9SPHN|nr:hypothetical protein [Croceibacterium salegens]MXO60634.1 hypothetical protein [Croceibacterium salegens]